VKPKFTKEEKKLIGRRIRDARNAEKLTLEQLAEKCECSYKHIGDVERGTVSVSWPLAVKIGKALNTGVDYYLADTYYWITIAAEATGNSMMKDRYDQMAREELAEEEYQKVQHLLEIRTHPTE